MLTATTSTAPAAALYTSGATPAGSSSSVSFSKLLASNTHADLANHSFRSGQLSIDMHADGQRINSVSYFDASGQKLTTSGFWPQDILRNCEKFNIPLSDLQGLGPQLDAAGVRYKPYEQYAGTGSNHGIDLDNLASGGMGTAYDWTQDPLVHLKGPSARAQLAADQALAQRLSLAPWTGPSTAANGSVQSATASTGAAASSATSSTSAAVPASALSALDELLQLIMQVKTSLQNATPTAQPAPLPSIASPASAEAARTTPVQADNGSPAATPTAPDPSTTQRLSQMKSLLELLLTQR